MKRFVKTAMAIATMASSGLIVSGTALAAAPNAEACTHISSTSNVKTCIAAFNQVKALAIVIHHKEKLLVCVDRPNGNRLACSNHGRYVSVAPGNSISAPYPNTGQAPKATYCADTRRRNPNGSTTLIAHICRPN